MVLIHIPNPDPESHMNTDPVHIQFLSTAVQLYPDISGLWIPIRMDPHAFYLLDPDPDPGGKIFQIKTEKGKEIANNCNFIQFLK